MKGVCIVSTYRKESHIVQSTHWDERNKMYVLADRVLWKDKLPYYEASVFDVTAEELEVDYLSHLDLGRDLDHWGPSLILSLLKL